MTRTPQDIFAAHASALAARDVPKLLEDYSDDAVLLTAEGPLEGKGAIGGWFEAALGALPEAEFTFDSAVFAEDALLLRWSAVSPEARVPDGVDTFVFVDGKIRLQTVAFTLETAQPS